MSARQRHYCLAALLALHCGLLAWSAWRHSPTVDEPAHLAAGLSHWHFGRFDLYSVNPPLVRTVAVVPVLFVPHETDWNNVGLARSHRGEFGAGTDFVRANGRRSFWLTTLARWACLPFSLLGAFYCWLWAKELHGGSGGFLAATLWCFSPMILGHGCLITADVPAAATALAATYHFRKWTQNPTFERGVLSAVMLGITLLTKLSLIVLFALFPVMWLITLFLDRRTNQRRRPLREFGGLMLLLAGGLFVLNIGYLGEGSGKRLREFEFKCAALGGSEKIWGGRARGNVFADSFLGKLPVPFPENYVYGLDHQKHDFERGRPRILLGDVAERPDEGWWYFYLVTALLKVPAGTLLLMLLALVSMTRHSLGEEGFLVLPALTIVFLASYNSGIAHFRYILPAYGFAIVWASQVAGHWQAKSRLWKTLVLIAVGSSVGSSLWNYPHSLAYYNQIAGGTRNGYRYGGDSSYDWGQDLIYLEEWLDQHDAKCTTEIVSFALYDIADAGFGCGDTDTLSSRPWHLVSHLDAEQPEWLAVSASSLTYLRAAAERKPNDERTELDMMLVELRKTSPDVRAGATIFLYRLPSDAVVGE